MAGKSIPSVVIAILLLLLGILFRDPLGYWFTKILSPVASGVWNLRNNFDSAESSQTANNEIFQERIELLSKENEKLKEFMGHNYSSSTKLVNILSSLYSSPYDTFIIDEGSDDGLNVGDRVVTKDGIALGEVIEVYPSISKVSLYSAAGRELEVFLDDSTRVRVIGEGNQNFFAELPQGLTLVSSSTFTLPGDGNYIFASIMKIKNNPGDAFQKVYARSPVNIHTLKFVYVIPQ